MTLKCLLSFVTLFGLLFAADAEADPITATFTVTLNSITVGQTSTVDLVLCAALGLTGGIVTLFSGDGQRLEVAHIRLCPRI
jgi:hypothetical protein